MINDELWLEIENKWLAHYLYDVDNGIENMPVKDKLKLAWIMIRYKLTYSDAVVLYGKYVSNWGGDATVWRFDALKNGRSYIPEPLPRLQSCIWKSKQVPRH